MDRETINTGGPLSQKPSTHSLNSNCILHNLYYRTARRVLLYVECKVSDIRIIFISTRPIDHYAAGAVGIDVRRRRLVAATCAWKFNVANAVVARLARPILKFRNGNLRCGVSAIRRRVDTRSFRDANYLLCLSVEPDAPAAWPPVIVPQGAIVGDSYEPLLLMLGRSGVPRSVRRSPRNPRHERQIAG